MDNIGQENQVIPQSFSEEERYPTPKQNNHVIKNISLLFAVVILLSAFGGISFFLAKQIYQAFKGNPQTVPGFAQSKITPAVTSAQNPLEWQVFNGPSKFTTAQSPYSFKYPPNWQYEPSLRHIGEDYVEDVIANDTSDLSKRYVLTIDTVVNKDETLEKFIAGHQSPGVYPNLAMNNFAKDSSINITDALWMIDRNQSGSGGNESAILLKGTTTVLLICSNCTDQIINQILSTFNFAK